MQWFPIIQKVKYRWLEIWNRITCTLSLYLWPWSWVVFLDYLERYNQIHQNHIKPNMVYLYYCLKSWDFCILRASFFLLFSCFISSTYLMNILFCLTFVLVSGLGILSPEKSSKSILYQIIKCGRKQEIHKILS